jgi:hypothetical protein
MRPRRALVEARQTQKTSRESGTSLPRGQVPTTFSPGPRTQARGGTRWSVVSSTVVEILGSPYCQGAKRLECCSWGFGACARGPRKILDCSCASLVYGPQRLLQLALKVHVPPDLRFFTLFFHQSKAKFITHQSRSCVAQTGPRYRTSGRQVDRGQCASLISAAGLASNKGC